jgi:hypothetical protein
MTGSSSFWMASSGAASFYNSISTKSLKFTQHSTGSNNERLTRTMGTVDSATDFSINFWVKRSDLLNTRNTTYPMTVLTFRDGTSGTALNEVQFGEAASWGDGFTVAVTHTNSGARILATTNLLRDTTAWYNIHVRGDLDNGTASEKLKIYINNVEASYATDNRGSYTEMTGFKAGAWTIGDYYNYGYSPACLLALFTYTDGNKYLPTAFCEVKEGTLIPKDPDVTYGNGGFRLAFASGTGVGTASSSTVGADTSGNDNHWTTTNIVASNVHPDNPENNFCTLNPLVISAGSPTLSEGNLKLAGSGTDYDRSYGTIGLTSGKWYAEFLYISGDNRGMFGIVREDSTLTDASGVYIGSQTNQYGIDFRARAYTGGTELFDVTNFDTGDIGLIALDIDGGKLWFGRRDVSGTTTIWYDNAGAANGDPSADSNPTYTGTFTGHTWFIGCHDYDGTVIHANFGQDGSFAAAHTSVGVSDANSIGDFNYIESGFLAICTSNLTEPTLGPNSDEQPDDHFETFTFTGNSSATRTISGLNFQPDLLWSKTRNQTFSHRLYDSTRGNDKGLFSNTDAAESTHDVFNGFTSDGYNTTTDGSAGDLLNYNTGTYVNWLWKANAGTTTTNDASSTGVGSIDSVYQANTTAGFSIVTYTGTSSAGTIAHGLGAVPKMYVVKNRTDSGTHWQTYHAGVATDPETDYLYLSTSAAVGDSDDWNDTAPTSTVFSVKTHNQVNGSGKDYVAYLFAEVQGYSKFGSYEGIANADGVYVHLGFRPKLLVCKNIDTSGSWIVFDSERHDHNIINMHLMWDTGAVEGTDDNMDFTATGFKCRRSSTSFNSAHTFIYMAFAEMPMKYSNAF